MASNNITAVEEESDDLMTCCICMELYDDLLCKPKFLWCHHTCCLNCIKIMVRLADTSKINCPKCKAISILPLKKPEALTTNFYVLNMVQMKKVILDLRSQASFSKFLSSEISIDRLSTSRQLHTHHFNPKSGAILVLHFLKDGYLVSGGGDGRILLWPTDKIIDDLRSTEPNIELKTKHSRSVMSLDAITSEKILSGGYDKKLLVHNANTNQLMYSFDHPLEIPSIAVQPSADVFATACYDGSFRLFDLRQSKTDPAFQSLKRPCELFTIMFSPVDSTILAVAGNSTSGALIYDIRNSKRYVYSVGSGMETVSARFNGSGTRLLCIENNTHIGYKQSQLVVYDVPNVQQQSTKDEKMVLQDASFGYRSFLSPDACCFAGSQDELVISRSSYINLFVWSMPDVRQGGRTIEKSLRRFDGQKSDEIVCVSYNRDESVLVTGHSKGFVKVWTSGVV